VLAEAFTLLGHRPADFIAFVGHVTTFNIKDLVGAVKPFLAQRYPRLNVYAIDIKDELGGPVVGDQGEVRMTAWKDGGKEYRAFWETLQVFTSDGKSWSAYLRFGGEATQSDRQRAYSVIESMRRA